MNAFEILKKLADEETIEFVEKQLEADAYWTYSSEYKDAALYTAEGKMLLVVYAATEGTEDFETSAMFDTLFYGQ